MGNKQLGEVASSQDAKLTRISVRFRCEEPGPMVLDLKMNSNR